MIRKLIDENKNAYKAALHVHTTISDGRMTPEAVRDAYYQAGYSVVAFTDHQVFVPHNDFTTDDFLAINSVEFAYSIREPNPDAENGCFLRSLGSSSSQ